MLIEFRVKNFRSIRDEQVLSMVAPSDKVASSDKKLRDTHVHETELKAVPGVLRSAVIYGANASGKTNLVKAMQYMCLVIVASSKIDNFEHISKNFLEPFRLDDISVSEPTELEVTFLIEGIRYQYGFSIKEDKIFSEHLVVYKTGKPQHWFERYFDEESEKNIYIYKFGLTGPKHIWEEATRLDSLFLSTAVNLNSKALKPIYDWFANSLVIFTEGVRLRPDYSVTAITKEDGHDAIRDFLVSADISISDIEIENDEIRFNHIGEYGTAKFDFDNESSGTKNLFALAGPMLDILKKGKTLVIDELDTSLHPLIVQEIVKLFNNPKTNTGNAQLIFTTHDTSLLDATGLFRRDQIWFTEKGKDQATSLIALAEFSPRKGEALERGYLSGRYGGIPFIDLIRG